MSRSKRRGFKNRLGKKTFNRWCFDGPNCEWCVGNRTHAAHRQLERAQVKHDQEDIDLMRYDAWAATERVL